jgi:hypothetical protein
VNRTRPALRLVALVTAAGLSIGPFACSSPESLSAQGGSCTVVTDCQDGLVCGKGPNGTRVCTNDLASLQPPQDSGLDDAANQAPQAEGSAGNDAEADSTEPPPSDARAPSDVASPPADVETVDVEIPPVDAGKPEDAGTPPKEAATPEASADDGSAE